MLPEATDARVLAAAEELTKRGLARIILLGDPEPVRAEARRLGIDISNVRLSCLHQVLCVEALSMFLRNLRGVCIERLGRSCVYL